MKTTIKKKFTLIISQKDFDDTLAARGVVMPDYIVQENAIMKIVAACPGFSLEEILAKSSIINDFYSTSIIDILSAAKNLHSVVNNIGLVGPGNVANCNAVMKIAEVHHGIKVWKHISFASKFASFCRPDLFPIYDSLVADIFCRLRRKGFFIINTKFSSDSLKKDYQKYKKVYDEFMALSGMNRLVNGTSTLTYKDVDNYLWTSRKVSLAKNGKNKAKVDLRKSKEINIILNNVLNRSI